MAAKHNILLCIVASYCIVSQAVSVNVELQSYNYPTFYVKTAHRLHGGRVTIANNAQPQIWNMITPGLCNIAGTVSFSISASTSNTAYMRHSNSLLSAKTNDGSDSFASNACFYVHSDKWFPGHAAFESVNTPGHFIRHNYLRLKLHSYSSTTIFEKDASFRILDPTCKRFRSYNYPSYYFGLNGRSAYILNQKPHELWVPVRPGLSGHIGSVSFRSCYNAKKYLRHSFFVIYSDSYDSSSIFKLDATFTEREIFFYGTTAYESVNYPNHFIRHRNSRLHLDAYDAAAIYKKDASFYEKDAP